jgi:hypothetical protein
MSSFLKNHKKRLIRISLVTALLTCYFTLFLRVELFQNQELTDAKAIWDASNIDSYRIVVEANTRMGLGFRYSITVQNGQIINAYSQGLLMYPAYDQNTPPSNQIALEAVSDYSVDRIFQRAVIELADVPPIHIANRANCAEFFDEIEYDAEFGYIKLLSASCTGCQISDCFSNYYRVVEFELLT